MEINSITNRFTNSTINAKGRKGEPSTNNKKVIAATIAGTTVGIVSAVALLAKGKEGKFLQRVQAIEYGAKDVILLGGASVTGGLVGGLLSDKKENAKPKLREALQQFGGNILVPVSMLAGALTLYEKHKIKIPNIEKFSEKTNKYIQAIPKAAVTIGTLLIGTKVGNVIMNKFTNKVFKEEKKRCIEAKDFSASVDDVCYSLPFVLDNAAVQKFVATVLPFIFLIPGYETGTKQA